VVLFQNKIRNIYILLSVLFLVLGIGIYLFFREIDKMIIFKWMPLIKINFPIKLNENIFSYFLMFNLPDMFWFLSGILFFRFLWFYNIKIQYIYILCFYVFGILLEISQLFTSVYGTFDWLDLLFFGIGAFVEGLLYNKFTRRRFV